MSDNDKVALPTEASDVTQGDGPVLTKYVYMIFRVKSIWGNQQCHINYAF